VRSCVARRRSCSAALSRKTTGAVFGNAQSLRFSVGDGDLGVEATARCWRRHPAGIGPLAAGSPARQAAASFFSRAASAGFKRASFLDAAELAAS
jgi:hypothetical protein